MKLEQVAKVIIGITLNREKANDGFNYNVFNFKSLEDKEPFLTFSAKRNIEWELTQNNDIIFRLIYPNKLFLIKDQKFTNLLVSSQFCIIRPNLEMINPDFLYWYLNSDEGKQKINEFILGTTIKKITVTSLRNLPIPDISIEVQNNLGNLINKWNQEKEILENIIENKNLLYNEIIKEKVEENNGK